jgi:hypothetical protein
MTRPSGRRPRGGDIICRFVCRYFDRRKCWLLLAASAALVRPYLCQRATYTGTLHTGKNQRLENRRPRRAAPHVADCTGDSGFALKPCCTRLSVLWRGARSPTSCEGSACEFGGRTEVICIPATHSRAPDTTHTVCQG